MNLVYHLAYALKSWILSISEISMAISFAVCLITHSFVFLKYNIDLTTSSSYSRKYFLLLLLQQAFSITNQSPMFNNPSLEFCLFAARCLELFCSTSWYHLFF